MASPAETSRVKTPAARSIRRAPLAAPVARCREATSAPLTALSAVTTTRLVAASTYQAVPGTAALPTAWWTPASWLALYCWGAAADWAGRATAPTAIAPTVAASSPPRRLREGAVICTGLLLGVQRDQGVAVPLPQSGDPGRVYVPCS